MLDNESVLAEAIKHHQAGLLAEAERLYRQVISSDDRCAEAFHLLGLIFHQVGRNDVAMELIGKAISINGFAADFHSSKGLALAGLGHAGQALSAYKAALCLNPAFAAVHYNKGPVLRSLGLFDKVADAYRTALCIRPDYAEALSNWGNALTGLGRREDAIANYRAALCLQPDYGDAWSNLGATLHQLGRLADAAIVLGIALSILPDFAEAYSNLGTILRDMGRLDEAVETYRAALRISPDYAAGHSNLGAALKGLGRFDEAIIAFKTALCIRPDYANAHYNLGVALRDRGDTEKAVAAYRAALHVQPDYGEAHTNLAVALAELGLVDKAVIALKTALLIDPCFAEAHTTFGSLLLLTGRFAQGWREYEWRWGIRALKGRVRDFGVPQWQGGHLEGRHILLYAEQGMGDAIQFCRYVPLVAALGGRVVLEVHRPLRRLLSVLPGVEQIVARGDALPPFDLHCPLPSLPRAFNTTADTIPAAIPYLAAEPHRVAQWRDRLGPSGFKVGIVWKGSPIYKADRSRSAPLAAFAPLAGIPGVRLISLQKRDGLEQLASLPHGMAIEPLGPDFDEGPDGFLDAAAVMMSLDLIVTIDSAVGHLAGALGRPVWLALPKVPHWPWMLEREDTPWYPKTRLFRQKVASEWDELFAAMAVQLGSIVQAGPRYDANYHCNRGNELLDRRRFAEAITACEKALCLNPDLAEAHYNRGIALYQSGYIEDAVLAYGIAIRIAPGFVEAYSNLGGALQTLGRFGPSVNVLGVAISLRPDFGGAYANLGCGLCELRRFDEAAAVCAAALHIRPDDARAHTNRALALQGMGRFEDALAACRSALCIEPALAEAHVNRAVALYALKRLGASAAACGTAARIGPDNAGAWRNLGHPLRDLGRLDAAVAAYRTALCLKPDDAEVYSNLGNALQDLGWFEDALAAYETALLVKPDYAEAASNLVMCLHYKPNVGHDAISSVARRFAAIVETGTATYDPRAPDPSRRLRIGYVSGDFRNHPVGYFLRGVLEHHDPREVDITCYSNNLYADSVTRELQTAAHHWRSVQGLSDQRAAELIAGDAIDILIDLSGHTAHNRLPLFARKPAPVQVTWLGFWGTTGLSSMDYILSDDVLIPPGEDCFYSEKVFRLPEGRFCYRAPDYAPPVSFRERDGIIFGSFNNLTKIGPDVVKLWAAVLHAVPGSKLLLKWKSLGDPEIRRRLTDLFAAETIGSERLDLRAASPHAAMLAEYGDIDIALDPFPFSGGLTSCEALWMGVPVITLPGTGAVSRQTAGFLKAIGHEEWIAADQENYRRVATELARDEARLEALRRSLRPRMAASPLCDGPGFTRKLERAYRRMWQDWCAAASP